MPFALETFGKLKISYFLIAIFLVLFPYVVRDRLYVDEANYLREALIVSKQITLTGYFDWFLNLPIIGTWTSSKYAYLSALFSFFSKDYYYIHFINNFLFLTLIILFLNKILERKYNHSQLQLNVLAIITTPLFLFTSFQFLKDLPFIGFSLGAIFFFIKFKEQQNRINYIFLMFFIILSFLVRPFFSTILFGGSYFFSKTSLRRSIKLILSYLIFVFIYVVIDRNNFVDRAEFFYLNIALIMSFYLKTLNRKSISFPYFISVPVIGIYSISIIKFIYITVFSKAATELVGTFSLSSIEMKIMAFILGLNGISLFYLLVKGRFNDLRYYLGILFLLILFVVVPHYDFRLLLNISLFLILYCLYKFEMSKKFLISIIIFNTLVFIFTFNQSIFSKRPNRSDNYFKEISVSMKNSDIRTKNILVLSNEYLMTNINKLSFYSYILNLDYQFSVFDVDNINRSGNLYLNHHIDAYKKILASVSSDSSVLIGPLNKSKLNEKEFVLLDFAKQVNGENLFVIKSFQAGEEGDFILISK